MKTIITGATGFIGRNQSESFHEEGIEVIATGRSPNIGKELQKTGIQFVAADITDLSQVDKVFCPADFVIHCAAKAGDWGTYGEFYKTNVIGTRNIIEGCKRNEIRKIIFLSTPSMYFNGEDRHNILESEPLPAKQFNYGKTKLMAESELLALGKEGFRTIIFRPRAVYGKYDQQVVPRFLRLSEKKNLPLINGGKALIDITYVGNLVSAVRSCFSAPDDAWNEVYNISNGSPITMREFISQVLEIFERPFKPKGIPEPVAKTLAIMNELLSHLPFGNKKPELTRFTAGYVAKSMTLSIDKAKQKLNYVPEISNQGGFEAVQKWYSQTK